MEKNNQHIVFDDLLALYKNNLGIEQTKKYKEHLDICEECQNNIEAIEAFNITALRKPHIEYAEKLLDERLLDITKQYIKESQRGKYIRMFKCHFHENRLKYLALVAASFLLIVFSQLTLSGLDKHFESAMYKYDKERLETILMIKFQKIATSNNDNDKEDMYFNDLLPIIADENMLVKVVGRQAKIEFYGYYNTLSIQGGQQITKVEVLNTNTEGKATELRITENTDVEEKTTKLRTTEQGSTIISQKLSSGKTFLP